MATDLVDNLSWNIVTF